MPKLLRSLLALAMACSVAGLPMPSQAGPKGETPQPPSATPAAPDPVQVRAAAHAKTIAAAKQAQAQAAVVKQAGADGPNEAYSAALMQYQERFGDLSGALWAEALVEPDVVARDAEAESAYDHFRRLKVSPDTAPLDMTLADDRRLATADALQAAKDAALTRVTARLEAEGYRLPKPSSPELYAKGMTSPLFDEPIMAGVHGFVFTPYTEAPWQVELQWADADSAKPPLSAVDFHSCGGALIAADWVITAAHCVWDRQTGKLHPPGDFRVRAGGKSLDAAMAVRAIDEIVLPGGEQTYVPSDAFSPARNDIALVHLSRPIRLGPKAAAAVVAYARPGVVVPLDTRGLTVSGWGATDAESFGDQTARVRQGGFLRMSPVLRFAPLDLIGNDECFGRIQQGIQEVYPNAKVGVLTPSSMCAGSQYTGTCVGDSGGPLVLHTEGSLGPGARRVGREPAPPGDRPLLVGIVSWGVGCENFTVFTRVSSYADWITGVITAPRRRPPAARRS